MGYTLLCQLTTAYRRLTRPSSPPTAKASTTYAYSLDHITPNNLKVKSQTNMDHNKTYKHVNAYTSCRFLSNNDFIFTTINSILDAIDSNQIDL